MAYGSNCKALGSLTDIWSKSKRSEVMSRIRGKGNEKTELRLARLIRAEGISCWRRHLPIFGRPDFAFRKQKVAVFVDGCFWHGCPRHYRAPAQNADFWVRKVTNNRKRDRLVSRTLKSKGWQVIRIWGHALKGDGRAVAGRVSRLLTLQRSHRS